MAEEEQEKPKRGRRRAKPSEAEATPTSEAPRSSDAGEEAAASDASASDADVSPSDAPVADEVTPADEDREAEQATEVVLEADDEAEGEVDASDGEEPVAAEEADPEAEEPVAAEADAEAEEPAAAAEADAEPEAPSAPAPSRRRSRERPVGPPPVVRAQAKYVRSSARKARLVCDHIRGKSVEDARAILATAPRAIARDWSKLLESAVANAEHNHELVGEDLYVKAVHADEGPTIKRFRPRAMGRATRIRKRTSHLTILLTPKE
jgi:ribosomal protein L22